MINIVLVKLTLYKTVCDIRKNCSDVQTRQRVFNKYWHGYKIIA